MGEGNHVGRALNRGQTSVGHPTQDGRKFVRGDPVLLATHDLDRQLTLEVESIGLVYDDPG